MLLPLLQSSAPAPGARLLHTGRPISAPIDKEEVVAIMGGLCPPSPPGFNAFSARMDNFLFLVWKSWRTLEKLDRRIGLRRDAT
jgi:hypothetical protein